MTCDLKLIAAAMLIDSQIDAMHPDLAGDVSGSYDAADCPMPGPARRTGSRAGKRGQPHSNKGNFPFAPNRPKVHLLLE
jgi:hypothetical protein